MNKEPSALRLGLTLAVYAVVSCTVLAFVSVFTAPRIKLNQINKANAGMKAVFSTASSFEEVTDFDASDNASIKIEKMYVAKDGENVIGAVTQVTGPTYDSATIIVGIDLDGKVTGVNFLKNTDSPGFGQKASDPTFTLSNGKTFYGQFEGMDSTKGFIINETFDAISGATITSNGVASLLTQGTQSALKVLKKYSKQEL